MLYSHAKAVLLDQDEVAVRQITELRKRNDLTVVELVSSPLYRGLLDRCRSELLPEGLDELSLEIASASMGEQSESDDETPDSNDELD